MPNGRCGGFIIETADLKRLVQALSNDAVVGRVSTGGRLQATRAVEMVRLIEECPDIRVNVEDQDHELYLIHLIDDYEHRSDDELKIVWVGVPSESPIFLDLRRRHEQWMAEHPGWDGWMAF
jgi:hypothetical protein